MPPQEDIADRPDDQIAEANGTSGFSEEDMDTEIEVDENGEEKPRRKKKKNGEIGQSPKEKRKNGTNERKKNGDSPKPPPYTENSDSAEEKKPKKQTMKSKMKGLLNEPFYLLGGIIVCVILPFGIYACDVILSVNVIDMQNYKNAIIVEKNNFTEIPTPLQLVGERYHVLHTVMHTVQFNAQNAKTGNARRISRDVSDQEEPKVVEAAVDPTQPTTPRLTEPTDPPTEPNEIVVSTTTKQPSMPSIATEGSPNTAPVNSTETGNTTRKSGPKRGSGGRFIPVRHLTNLRPVPSKRTVLGHVNESWFMQQDGEYCRGLYYFYNLHLDYYNETGQDWFDDMTSAVYKKEQTMFFMFTIIGFITLLIGLGLRCDVFLSDEWSSFILINLFFYSISMAVTVAIFADESGRGDLRCATCRFTSYCYDVNPWDYTTHWPADPDNVQWAMVALISFVLKLLDCFAIGIVTLKFIVDVTEAWWITCLKVFGWMFIFPMLIFTPMLGVARYVTIPRVIPDDVILTLVVEVFFFVGVVFWGLFVIVLPFFCKMRMCSGSEEEERQEEEEMYE